MPATTTANHHPWPLAATPTSGKHLCRIAAWTARHFSPRHWGAPASNQSDSAATKAVHAVASSQIPAWSSRATDHPRKDKHRRVNPAKLHVLHSGSVAADSKSRAEERGLSSRYMDAAYGSFLGITLRTPDHEARYGAGNTSVESQCLCRRSKVREVNPRYKYSRSARLPTLFPVVASFSPRIRYRGGVEGSTLATGLR